VVLDAVVREANIRLLLNTAVFALEKHDPHSIRSVRGFCSQNSTLYTITAPLFCDASGDGIVGYLAGASFRMGAESPREFGEKFAPSVEYGSLLGHSLFFYSKDVGRPVRFAPPDFALKDIGKIPRYRHFTSKDHGCQLWWIEYGGRLDTIHDSEEIKWELWRIVYGVWNYIKNSGKFPGAETLTLEWVGMIPGKRESRRFEGDLLLVQQDIVEQRPHYDAVSYGGWAIDLHPADGIYSNKPGCDQWHSKGIYPIPYRCLYSRDIRNLFLAGRLISASHVACGSLRVMMTCAHSAQAVGMAAALCVRDRLLARDLSDRDRVGLLQQELIKRGQYIPQIRLQDPEDAAGEARITASSTYRLARLAADGPWQPLTDSWAMLLPAGRGALPKLTLELAVSRPTRLVCELRVSDKKGNFTPDQTLKILTVPLDPVGGKSGVVSRKRGASAEEQYHLYTHQNGSMDILPDRASFASNVPTQAVCLDFGLSLDEAQYVFVCLRENPAVSVRCSNQRVTGILALTAQAHRGVSANRVQKPRRDIGVDTMEFWIPQRWPEGRNFALRIEPPLEGFGPENVRNGVQRPLYGVNAWVAALEESAPTLTLTWKRPKTLRLIELRFDTDFDHPLESVLLGHPFRVIPYCVRTYKIRDALGRVICACRDNHQTRNIVRLDPPVSTDVLSLELHRPDANIPAALFEIRCYE
ncbi:MAG: FAD-dependent oxidoreductase, partial [Sedimentisphaerales bacterium]|nr:FAD-dependent oxidoreductase [Sedimentisphaerales bacterium]